MSQEYIILEGKDLNLLIEEALNRLKKEKSEVDIEVLEKGKTLMGICIKEFKIKVSLKSTVIEEIERTLNSISDKVENKRLFKLDFLEDGVYVTLDNQENSFENSEQILNRIRKKRISNIDLKTMGELLSSKGEKTFRIAPEQEEFFLDAGLLIDISKDGLSGYVTLTSPDGGKELSLDDALEKINEEIKFGLNNTLVEEIIRKKTYDTKILIAQGDSPIQEEDGYIKYFFAEKKKTTPNILEDGSADFRNLDLIHNVRNGDILAELIPPTKGKDGMTVRGDILYRKVGKEASFRLGKNVIISEDGSKLISKKDGQVRLEDNKVNVYEIYEIKGNVDNSTGNVKFNGAVRIKGSVLTGFKVNADGDVEIEGVVEGAEINSKGSILLKRGIQGYNKGKLISQGPIVAKYIENSYIDAGSDITSEAIMHSEITSKGSIKVGGKKGLIVGGTCKATNEIKAKIIGSSMATATILEVGMDPNQRINHDEIKNKISELEGNVEKLDRTINLINRLSKSGEIGSDKEDMLIKSVRTKELFMEKINTLKKELSSIDVQIAALSKGKIKVEGVIYPGVKIIIGNSTMFVRDEIKYCTIYREQNEIKIGPYES